MKKLPPNSYIILPPLAAHWNPKRCKSFELHFPKNFSHCSRTLTSFWEEKIDPGHCVFFALLLFQGCWQGSCQLQFWRLRFSNHFCSFVFLILGFQSDSKEHANCSFCSAIPYLKNFCVERFLWHLVQNSASGLCFCYDDGHRSAYISILGLGLRKYKRLLGNWRFICVFVVADVL